jgi:uncharacterized protein (TIGR00251 family)
MKEEIIEIKITTGANKNEIIRDEKNKIIKIKVCTLPIDGQANKEIIKLISKEYKTAKSNIEIIKGLKNKNKKIKIVY